MAQPSSSKGTANTTKKYFTCMVNTGCHKGISTIRNPDKPETFTIT
jgi:hypothetical protein